MGTGIVAAKRKQTFVGICHWRPLLLSVLLTVFSSIVGQCSTFRNENRKILLGGNSPPPVWQRPKASPAIAVAHAGSRGALLYAPCLWRFHWQKTTPCSVFWHMSGVCCSHERIGTLRTHQLYRNPESIFRIRPKPGQIFF